MLKSKLFSESLPYFFISVISLLLAWFAFGTAPGFSLHVSRSYAGDGLYISALIKDVIQHGWYWTNPSLGAPGISELYDFPSSDSATMGFFYLLSFFSHNYAVLFNVFFFLSFPICSAISFYVFSKLGLKTWFAIGASLLYAFIPYHFLRSGGHILLCAYYVAPLYILFATDVFQGKSFAQMSKGKIFWRVVAIAFSVSSGIYYAYFGAFFILLAGVYAWSKKNQKNVFFSALVVCALIFVVAAINLLPTLMYEARVGSNAAAAHRETISTVEIASLKMSQMLLPVLGHRVGFLRKITDSYNAHAPLVNENMTASLGLVGSIGFVSLLWVFMMRRRSVLNQNIELFGLFNLSAVLLATVGGLSFLSLPILPEIRSYNRISVFISFFVFYAVFYYLQKKSKSHYFFSKSFFILALVVILGLLDEIPGRHENYVFFQQEMLNDQHYVEKIEKVLPQGSSVFQLPYVDYPEGGGVLHLTGYDPLRLYLSSKNLKWSYGAMKGRGVAYWQSTVANMPPKEMLDKLVLAGFSGVSISREAYTDGGKALEEQFTALLGESPLQSENKKLFFYNLIPYGNRLRANLGASVFEKQEQALLSSMYVGFTWKPDFSAEHFQGEQHWRWGGERNRLVISNDGSEPVRVSLRFSVQTANALPAQLKIDGGPFHEVFAIGSKPVLIQKTFVLKPGVIKLGFETNAKKNKNISGEDRAYFKINNFVSQEDELAH